MFLFKHSAISAFSWNNLELLVIEVYLFAAGEAL